MITVLRFNASSRRCLAPGSISAIVSVASLSASAQLWINVEGGGLPGSSGVILGKVILLTVSLFLVMTAYFSLICSTPGTLNKESYAGSMIEMDFTDL